VKKQAAEAKRAKKNAKKQAKDLAEAKKNQAKKQRGKPAKAKKPAKKAKTPEQRRRAAQRKKRAEERERELQQLLRREDRGLARRVGSRQSERVRVSRGKCDTTARRRKLSEEDRDIIRREILASSRRQPFTERQIAERYCITPGRAKRIRSELSKRLDIVKVGMKACRAEYASVRPTRGSKAERRVRDVADCMVEEDMRLRNKVMFVGKDGTTYIVEDTER